MASNSRWIARWIAARRQPPAAPAHEHRAPVAAGPADQRLPEVKIAPEREHRPRADRDDPLLPALAAHLDLVGQQVEVRRGSIPLSSESRMPVE